MVVKWTRACSAVLERRRRLQRRQLDFPGPADAAEVFDAREALLLHPAGAIGRDRFVCLAGTVHVGREARARLPKADEERAQWR